MRLVLLLAARHLFFRPGRTLLSALGIAMGIATVVAVLTVDHNTLLSQQARRIPDDPGADLLIQPLQRAPAALEQAQAELRAQNFLRGVTAFGTGRRTLSAAGPQAGGKTKARELPDVEVMAVEAGASAFHHAYEVAEGSDLDFTSEAPQLLVSAAVAEQLKLRLGDTVALSEPPARRGPKTRCVDGKLVVLPEPRRAASGQPERFPFTVAGILAASRLGYSKSRVITTFSEGRALLGDDLEPRFWADLDTRQSDFLGAEARLRDDFTVLQPKRALAGLSPEESAFRGGVRLCGFLALFLGLYIIFNTMSMSLVERVRQIGLLRALGLTRGRLFMVFLVEGIVLSLLGAGLSVVLAERIVAAMAALHITTLGFGKPLEIVEVPWGPVAAVMGAGVLFSLLGIIYPFLRAAGLSVIDALRRGVIALSDDPFTGARRSILVGLLALVPVAWFIGSPAEGALGAPLWKAFVSAFAIVAVALAVPLLLPGLLPALARALLAPLRGASIVLARGTISSARHRVFATVSGLMLVFAAIFLVISVLEGLKADTRTFAARALAGRLYLKTTPEGAERVAELRAAVPELTTLSPLNVEVHSPFLVRAVDERLLSTGSLAGDHALRRAFVAGPTLILSTRCADDFGYVMGDRVRLATAADGPVDFQVLAVTDEYGFAPDDRVFAAVSTETMKRWWCLDSAGLGNYFVASAGGVGAGGVGPGDVEPLQQRIEAVLGPGNVLALQRGEAIEREYLVELDRDFAIFYAILLLTVVLAALGVLNAMVISVMERRREIGLLRAVGLTGGQVARMLLVESAAFGVLGGVLGLLLGVPLSMIALRVLASTSHLDLAFEWSPRAIAAVVGGAALVAVLAVLYPALRANRLRIAEVMRYE